VIFKRRKNPKSYDESVDIWAERNANMLKEERASDHVWRRKRLLDRKKREPSILR